MLFGLPFRPGRRRRQGPGQGSEHAGACVREHTAKMRRACCNPNQVGAGDGRTGREADRTALLRSVHPPLAGARASMSVASPPRSAGTGFCRELRKSALCRAVVGKLARSVQVDGVEISKLEMVQPLSLHRHVDVQPTRTQFAPGQAAYCHPGPICFVRRASSSAGLGNC